MPRLAHVLVGRVRVAVALAGHEAKVDRTTDRFLDKQDAGRALAACVRLLDLADPVVLTLPRGGVPVAEVADILSAPLDGVVARKIGLPGQPQFGVGVAEGGQPLLDEAVLSRLGVPVAALEDTIARERADLARRVAQYRGDRQLPQLTARAALQGAARSRSRPARPRRAGARAGDGWCDRAGGRRPRVRA